MDSGIQPVRGATSSTLAVSAGNRGRGGGAMKDARTDGYIMCILASPKGWSRRAWDWEGGGGPLCVASMAHVPAQYGQT